MKVRFACGLLALAMISASIVLGAGRVKADGPGLPDGQGGVVLENVGATYVFGEQITFLAGIKASAPIQSASIAILEEGSGVAHIQPLAIQPDGSMQFVLDVSQRAMRPFAFVRWRYEFIFNDGGAIQSETYFIRYDDNRFAWQSLESNNLRIHWVQGDSAFAQTAMNAALAGVREINQIVPVDLDQPIDVYLYPSQNDMPVTGADAWAAGHADAPLGVTLVIVEPGLDQSLQMEQRIPHELMHVLLYRRIGAGYGNLPAWLREGLAVMVEINPTTEYDRLLRDAARREALIPLMDLCASFPSAPDAAFLAYAESRSFTTHLRSTYGSSRLLELARTYADGVSCERGVEMVYGTSLARLEFTWRRSVLGQTALGAAFRNLLPYLVLLCLVLGIPLTVGFNAMRKKDKATGG
jgi:hypothetical protein